MSPNLSPFRFAIALVVIMMLFAMATSAFAAAVALTPREAIERAIVARMGGNVSVLVDVLRTDVVSEPGLQAQLDPSARSGHAVRFLLTAGGTRLGAAVAEVQLVAPHARAARAIARDEILTADAVEMVTGELPNVRFRRLPAAEAVIGLRAKRAIAAGEPLTGTVLDEPPVIKAGDEITVLVTAGRAQVSSRATASSSGHEGDVIRVTAAGTRRAIRARIVGPELVEVVQ